MAQRLRSSILSAATKSWCVRHGQQVSIVMDRKKGNQRGQFRSEVNRMIENAAKNVTFLLMDKVNSAMTVMILKF